MPRAVHAHVRLARRAAAVLAALLSVSAARSAHADDGAEDAAQARTAHVLLVGGAIELVPFAVGGAMVANSGNVVVRRGSVYLTSAGFTLAPLLAHGLMDEWGRGAVFASVPLACGVGLAVVMQQPGGDVLTQEGSIPTRVPFWILASTALASSAFGIVDAALAPHRRRPRALYVVPGRVPSGVALNMGGAF